MASVSGDFYRIQKLPPYVFAVINEMKAKARAAQMDVVDLGMGNPDGATPEPVVKKAIEAIRNPRNHRYSMSRGIPRLREEITRHYRARYALHRLALHAVSIAFDHPVSGTRIHVMAPVPGDLAPALLALGLSFTERDLRGELPS